MTIQDQLGLIRHTVGQGVIGPIRHVRTKVLLHNWTAAWKQEMDGQEASADCRGCIPFFSLPALSNM